MIANLSKLFTSLICSNGIRHITIFAVAVFRAEEDFTLKLLEDKEKNKTRGSLTRQEYEDIVARLLGRTKLRAF